MKRVSGWLWLVLIGVILAAVFLGGYMWQTGTGMEVFKSNIKSEETGEVALDEAGSQAGVTGEGQIGQGVASYSLRGHFVVGPVVDQFGRLTGRLVATGDKAGRASPP